MKPIHITAPLEDPRESAPPRPRWLIRVLLGGLGVWMLLVGTWVALLLVADHALNQEIRAAQLRHEPVLIGDFASGGLPDERNSAHHLRLAFNDYHPNQDEALESEGGVHADALSPAMLAKLDRYVEANQQALAELRVTRNCTAGDWRLLDPDDSAAQRQRKAFDHIGSLALFRQMSWLLYDAAILAHAKHDDAAAIEYIRDILGIARACDEAPGMVGHTISIGIEAIACAAADELTASLDSPIASASTQRSRRPGSRQATSALIDEFLQDAPRAARARRAFLGERAMILSFAGEYPLELRSDPNGKWGLFEPPLYQRAINQICRPIFYWRAVNDARTLDRAIQALNCNNAPAAAVVAGTSFVSGGSTRIPLARWMNTPGVTGAENVVDMQFREMIHRRIVGVLLALRLYEIDHAGQLPISLTQLAGRYLPSVPADPFSPKGSPLGYVRRGQASFVYSIGEDGVDNVASGWVPTASVSGEWNRSDYVVMFDPHAISTTASSVKSPASAPSPGQR